MNEDRKQSVARRLLSKILNDAATGGWWIAQSARPPYVSEHSQRWLPDELEPRWAALPSMVK
jgi:hypothetical protein